MNSPLPPVASSLIHSSSRFGRAHSLSSRDRLRIHGACARSHESCFDTMTTATKFELVFSASATRGETDSWGGRRREGKEEQEGEK